MAVIFDLSEWQEEVDWDAIAEEADAVILRIGRDNSVMDDLFCEHLANAQARRLPVGVYYYSSARNRQDAVNDADWVFDAVEDYVGYIPPFGIWYDVEKSGREDVATEVCQAWLNRMLKRGYDLEDIGIYASWSWTSQEDDAEGCIDLDALPADLPLWIAQYDNNCDLADEREANIRFWQYTNCYSDELPYDASVVME